jgi:hypothetical protein
MRAQLPRKPRLISRSGHKLKENTVFHSFHGKTSELVAEKLHHQPK